MGSKSFPETRHARRSGCYCCIAAGTWAHRGLVAETQDLVDGLGNLVDGFHVAYTEIYHALPPGQRVFFRLSASSQQQAQVAEAARCRSTRKAPMT